MLPVRRVYSRYVQFLIANVSTSNLCEKLDIKGWDIFFERPLCAIRGVRLPSYRTHFDVCNRSNAHLKKTFFLRDLQTMPLIQHISRRSTSPTEPPKKKVPKHYRDYVQHYVRRQVKKDDGLLKVEIKREIQLLRGRSVDCPCKGKI